VNFDFDFFTIQHLDAHDFYPDKINVQDPCPGRQRYRTMIGTPGTLRMWCGIECGTEIVTASASVKNHELINLGGQGTFSGLQ